MRMNEVFEITMNFEGTPKITIHRAGKSGRTYYPKGSWDFDKTDQWKMLEKALIGVPLEIYEIDVAHGRLQITFLTLTKGGK